jgi:hypothetical protein
MSRVEIPNVYLAVYEVNGEPTQCNFGRRRCAVFKYASKPVQFFYKTELVIFLSQHGGSLI